MRTDNLRLSFMFVGLYSYGQKYFHNLLKRNYFNGILL